MGDHLVTHHTKETKLTICPYCSKDLSDLVYWVHLEEHMNQTSTPTTPTKVQTKVNTPDTTPVTEEVSPIKTPEVKENCQILETKTAPAPAPEDMQKTTSTTTTTTTSRAITAIETS